MQELLLQIELQIKLSRRGARQRRGGDGENALERGKEFNKKMKGPRPVTAEHFKTEFPVLCGVLLIESGGVIGEGTKGHRLTASIPRVVVIRGGDGVDRTLFQ